MCEAEIDWSCLNLCSRDGFWLRTEGLLWWTNDDSIPTLATSSPLGTPTADAGILGLPTTTRLFGDSLYGDARFGGRVRFGTWADDCKHGIDGSIWGLLNESDQNVWQSAGDPLLARPFNNVDPLVDAPAAQILAEDGVLSGRLRINTSSEIFGGDIGIRKNVWCCADVCGSTSTRLDCVAGYRYFKVREGVRVIEDLESTALVGPTVLGTTINVYDDFQTRNEFNGANIGFVLAQQYKRLTAEFTGRLALGNLSREVMIDGATTVTVPGLAPVTSAGGLLAQPSNIGTYRNDDFAVLPEVQFNMLYNIRRNTRLSLGYTFMYLGDIVRPGDVMDTSVNGTVLDPTVPVTGPDRPQFTFDDSRTWLMGLNFGVEVNF